MESWSDKNADGRRFVDRGYRIRGEDRLDPLTAQYLGPATDEETALWEALRHRVLSMPNGASNPVANLY